MLCNCTAFGTKNCTKTNGKQTYRDAGISFHAFSHVDKKLMQIWIHNIKRQDFVPSQNLL